MIDDQNIDDRLRNFERAVLGAAGEAAIWQELRALAATIASFKLFTVMTVDLPGNVARRAFSSHPADYPVSGTKPIHRDSWFDVVHGEKRTFVANTIADIAKVFPDYEKIRLMGCGSVVNLPVIIDGELAATINMLDVENVYTPERVAMIEKYLSAPAALATKAARLSV